MGGELEGRGDNGLVLLDAALQCDAWFEWVPSKAKIADLPSRPASTWSEEDAVVMRQLRARRLYAWRALRLPSEEELSSPAVMLGRARSVAAAAAQGYACERPGPRGVGPSRSA